MESPLHQFEVLRLIPLHWMGLDFSLTNSGLFMGIVVFSILLLLFFALKKGTVVPDRLQCFGEMCFEFIGNMLDENVGPDSHKFFPFVFSLFLFILFGNLFGMLPYAFTFTSQLIVTFALASVVFMVVTMVGFMRHGVKFLTIFMPEGAPWVLFPILIPIELVSFLSRPVSLAIRLFANMMAGHTMIKVFALFTIALGFFGIPTIIINALLIGFEFLVAFLQAYVFSVLTCLYLKDAIYLH